MDAPTERTHLSLTIVRLSSGWRSLLPSRSNSGWRPLVTVCADSPGCHAGASHEVQLGSDAQNPNLRVPFLIHVEEKGKLCIQVWQRPQTKKKTNKRTLVATHTLDVRLAIRRFGPDTQLELPLHSTTSKPVRLRGQRSPASVFVKLRAPADWASTSRREPDDLHAYHSDVTSDHGYATSEPSPRRATFSDTENEDPISPVVRPPTPDGVADGLRKRKRTKKKRGYHLFSDTDGEGSAFSSGEHSDHDHDDNDNATERPPNYSDLDLDLDEITPRAGGAVSDSEGTYFPRPSWEKSSTSGVAIGGWIAASIIPRYVSDTVSIASTRSRAETMLDSFTPYHELRIAEDSACEEDFGRVLERLKNEWYAVGASLVALAGLDAAVFGFSSDSVFSIAEDPFSLRMVALSSVASGLGLCTTTWMILWYSFSDVPKFQKRARDVYGTYTFFCLSCRVPALLMGTSALALTGFLIRVAWSAWPAATLVMSVLAGTIVGLQYLVWVVHAAARLVVWGIKAVRRVVLRVLARKTERRVEEGLSVPGTQEGQAVDCDAERAPRPPPALAPLQMPVPRPASSMIADALRDMEVRMPEPVVDARRGEEDIVDSNERVRVMQIEVAV